MAYSERPNINFISTSREPNNGHPGTSRFIEHLLGVKSPPQDGTLVAIEPKHNPTNTSLLDRGVYYLLLDPKEDRPLVILRDPLGRLASNGINASRPMDEILDDLVNADHSVYDITPLETLSRSRAWTTRGTIPQGATGFEVFKYNLGVEFERLVGMPREIAFRVEARQTAEDILNGNYSADITPLSPGDSEKIKEGWRSIGLIE